jgi:hypothetical protein
VVAGASTTVVVARGTKDVTVVCRRDVTAVDGDVVVPGVVVNTCVVEGWLRPNPRGTAMATTINIANPVSRTARRRRRIALPRCTTSARRATARARSDSLIGSSSGMAQLLRV